MESLEVSALPFTPGYFTSPDYGSASASDSVPNRFILIFNSDETISVIGVQSKGENMILTDVNSIKRARFLGLRVLSTEEQQVQLKLLTERMKSPSICPTIPRVSICSTILSPTIISPTIISPTIPCSAICPTAPRSNICPTIPRINVEPSKSTPTSMHRTIIYGVKLTPNDLVDLLPSFPQLKKIIEIFCGMKNDKGVTTQYHRNDADSDVNDDEEIDECECDDCTGKFAAKYPNTNRLAKTLNIGSIWVLQEQILQKIKKYGFHSVPNPKGYAEELIWGWELSDHFNFLLSDSELTSKLIAHKACVEQLCKIRSLGWRVLDSPLWKDPKIYRF